MTGTSYSVVGRCGNAHIRIPCPLLVNALAWDQRLRARGWETHIYPEAPQPGAQPVEIEIEELH